MALPWTVFYHLWFHWAFNLCWALTFWLFLVYRSVLLIVSCCTLSGVATWSTHPWTFILTAESHSSRLKMNYAKEQFTHCTSMGYRQLRNKHFSTHSQEQILFRLHGKFMPCKDKSTPKGYYFSLAAMSGEYDVTAVFTPSSYLWDLLLKRQIKRPTAPVL